ncbi:creatininase family protein [Rhodoferax sp. PAMC 29310]|uniref:creatininase family protein n=1 Tax=Rhodoferax sp. PAMC 29310 TaxID=2822760 RepID=UPI001B320D07|nr:creatininase family protein [Rhodoferax sp. PAMC 29310]
MTTSSRFWANLSTLEFSDRIASGAAANTVAVLPVAATEQHGPHLPLSVDTVLVDGVVSAALPHLAPELDVLFLPTQAVGFSPEHARFPGTLTLKSDTLVRLWTEIGECVAAAGVKKLVLFNAHGGQVSVMDIVARDLRARLDMLVYSVSWFNLPLVNAQGGNVNELFSAEEHRFGIHAGDVETSMMLALDPAHVDMTKARHFYSTSQARASQFDILGNGKSAKLGWQTQDYNPAGAVGNAAAATGDKGQALVDAAGLGLARLLAQVHQLPLSTLVAAPDFSPP